jgi:predicted Kef-type K+ transport protein
LAVLPADLYNLILAGALLAIALNPLLFHAARNLLPLKG